MKIKIFFLIFSLQFILYSCITVKFHNNLIKQYSDEIKVSGSNIFGIGFVLDVSNFEEDESIYFKIILSERDSEHDVYVLINFESTFDISDDNSLDFKSIDRKSTTSKKNNKVTYYYETSKDSSDLNYLKIIVVSEYGFQHEVGFENTKDDEPKESNKDIIFVIVALLCFVLILVIVFLIMRYLQKKRAKENELINQNSQQIYTYSTVPAQKNEYSITK